MDKWSKIKKLFFFTSEDFHKHLLGLAKDCENYSQTDVYIWACIFFIITLFTPLVYYKLLDEFRYSRLLCWAIFGLGFAFLNALVLWFFIRPASMRCEELNFDISNIWGFLLLDVIYAFIVYFFASQFLWKRLSKNHRNIPF